MTMKLRAKFQRVVSMGIFHQLGWYTAGQICIQLFSFFGVIVTSRYLGPTNVGLYSFVQNYLLAFMTLTAGMEFYFTWKLAKSEERLHDVKEYFGYKLNVTLLLSLVGIITAWIVLPKDVAMLATIMFAPLFLTSCSVFSQYAVVTHNARMIAMTQVFANAASLLVKVALVYFGAPLISFVVVGVADIVLVGVILMYIFLLRHENLSLFLQKPYPSFWKTASFMYSIRTSLIAVALWQLILRIDQLVLATFSNAYTLGIYSAAVKIAEVPNFLAGALYTALVTHVSIFAIKEDEHSKRRIRQVLILYATIGLAIAALVILFAPLAIHLLYGAQFMDAVPVLRVYALSIPGMFVAIHYFGIYGAREMHWFQACVFFFALVANVVLIFILTPLCGLWGAALATVIAYSSVAVTFYFHLR